jgi:hypothetical protein
MIANHPNGLQPVFAALNPRFLMSRSGAAIRSPGTGYAVAMRRRSGSISLSGCAPDLKTRAYLFYDSKMPDRARVSKKRRKAKEVSRDVTTARTQAQV